MLSKILIFLAGSGVGFLAFYLMPIQEVQTEKAPAIAPIKRQQAPKADLNELSAQIVDLKVIVSDKNEEIALLEKALEDVKSEKDEEDRDRDRQIEERLSRWQKRSDSRITSQVNSLRNNIGLSSGQFSLVEDFLRKKSNGQIELHRLRYKGELTDELEAEIKSSIPEESLSEYLKSILDEEQYAEYAEYTAEQNELRMESRAARELSRLAEIVRLTDDQKNAAYEALYNQEKYSVKDNDDSGSSRWRRSDIDTDTRVANMINVLTPEQLESYNNELKAREELRGTYNRFRR